MIGRRDCTKRRTTVFVDMDPAAHNLNRVRFSEQSVSRTM